MNPPAQTALFDAVPPVADTAINGVPAGRFDPAAYDAALTGDGYGWLASLLPAPRHPACDGCGQPMTLPAAVPVLWACPACHPGEAA
jgi:hypothetical protein